MTMVEIPNARIPMINGPCHGQGLAITKPTIPKEFGFPLDERFSPGVLSGAYASARYGLWNLDGAPVYRFLGIELCSKEPINIFFLDGPLQGESIPPRTFLPPTFMCPVSEEGTFYKSYGLPSAIAEYQLTIIDGRCCYVFESLDESDESTTKYKEQVDDQEINKRVKQFYEKPDYSIYSITPTDDHKQVRVEVGYRQGDVDEGIAPIIELLWGMGLDTFGSCQERPAKLNNPGRAYVAFWRMRDARRFEELLKEGGFEYEFKEKELKMYQGDPDDPKSPKIEVMRADLLFPCSQIPTIIEFMRTKLPQASNPIQATA